jgi:general secretion pathway protein A
MRGIGLVTGDSGSGKTTTCRRLVADLHTDLDRVLYVSMTTGNVMDMYKSIAWELGLSAERNRAALFNQIRGEVTRLCAENRPRPVLIVDEAHHLRTEQLEDLRLLTNYAMESENRLIVVLVGPPELRRHMGMAALDALSQRIVVRANVRGLQRDELGPYLTHRLRLAGCELPLFETAAVEAIFQAASGLPRKATRSPITRCSPPPSRRPRPSTPRASRLPCTKCPEQHGGGKQKGPVRTCAHAHAPAIAAPRGGDHADDGAWDAAGGRVRETTPDTAAKWVHRNDVGSVPNAICFTRIDTRSMIDSLPSVQFAEYSLRWSGVLRGMAGPLPARYARRTSCVASSMATTSSVLETVA